MRILTNTPSIIVGRRELHQAYFSRMFYSKVDTDTDWFIEDAAAWGKTHEYKPNSVVYE